MAPAMTEAPKVDLFDGTGITSSDNGLGVVGHTEDAHLPDAISDDVGRPGYISLYTEHECLLPLDPTVSENNHQPAVFDRYYFAAGDAEPVFVDTVPGGPERAEQEAKKHIAVKRRWCKKRGAKYIVRIDDATTYF
jgi:hypothetical protein